MVVSLVGVLNCIKVFNGPLINVFVLYITESNLGAVLVLINFDLSPGVFTDRIVNRLLAHIQTLLQIHKIVYAHKDERNVFYVDRLV